MLLGTTDHEVYHFIAVVKLTPTNKLSKVVIEGNDRSCIKREGMGDIVKGTGDNFIFSIAQDSLEGPSNTCTTKFLMSLCLAGFLDSRSDP